MNFSVIIIVINLKFILQKWRPFCQKFEKEIEDFNFATLVRIDPEDEYSEKNTILVTRIQFLCIEISRNREGKNDSIKTKFKPKPRVKKSGNQ